MPDISRPQPALTAQQRAKLEQCLIRGTLRAFRDGGLITEAQLRQALPLAGEAGENAVGGEGD